MTVARFVLVMVLLVAPITARASTRSTPAPDDTTADARFAHTIGEHATTFAIDTAHEGRAHNVALAAFHLDGTLLDPGATLSFDHAIGERTIDAGFSHAPELHDGHLHEGVGGGVCQVATTLHVASLEAGLEIVEHHTHSIPVSYADAGLDATVSHGRLDFRVRNAHAFPVRIRATAQDGVLVVRIEAAEAIPSATVSTRTIRTIAAPEHSVDDASLAPGARVVEERGRDALVIRVRATRDDGTQVDRIVRYRSSPRIVRVAI